LLHYGCGVAPLWLWCCSIMVVVLLHYGCGVAPFPNDIYTFWNF